MNAYAEMVKSLAKPGEDILKDLTPLDCHIDHMAKGICGEAGELLDAIKRLTVYRKPLDMDNVVEELGDIEFFLEGLRQGLNITREETLEANFNKLNVRYGKGTYSDQQAQDRADKTNE